MESISFTEMETLNKIIVELYDDETPLHNRILKFFNNLIRVFYFDKATILFFYKNQDGLYSKHSSISINWEQEQVVDVKQYDKYFCHLDDTLPIYDQETPILFRASTFFDPEKRMENEYWKDYLVPNNCIHSLEGNLQLKNKHGLKGGLCFYRGGEKRDFSDKDLDMMRLLQPHLSNVLKRYGEKTDSTSILFTLESYHCVGIAMLDSNYQVVRSNPTFKRIVGDEHLGSKIKEKAISLCIETNQKSLGSENQSSEYKSEEAPIFMEVTKLTERESFDSAQYSCLIYDLSHLFTKTLDQAKERYLLTEREFDILQAVLKGKSNDEIASELYLSLPTVKKYLASLYGKMEIKSQKQIFEKLKFQ